MGEACGNEMQPPLGLAVLTPRRGKEDDLKPFYFYSGSFLALSRLGSCVFAQACCPQVPFASNPTGLRRGVGHQCSGSQGLLCDGGICGSGRTMEGGTSFPSYVTRKAGRFLQAWRAGDTVLC